MIELIRAAVATKRDNVKLVDLDNHLEIKWEAEWSVELLVCVNLEVVSNSIKNLEVQVKILYAK